LKIKKNTNKNKNKNLYIGLMSGTSCDSIDTSLVSIDSSSDSSCSSVSSSDSSSDSSSHQSSNKPYDKFCKIDVINHRSYDIPAEIKQKYANLLDNYKVSLLDLGKLDVAFGKLFSNCVKDICKINNIDLKDIAAIGSHGQTIYHYPHGEHPFTMQIGDPNVIFAQTGITTIADFRRLDVAFGGQGAPLTPLFHKTMFKDDKYKLNLVLNIGGIANITAISDDNKVIGYDTGPGNCLLDLCSSRYIGKPFDNLGLWGKSGDVSQNLLDFMLKDEYFSKSAPKSTGREYFSDNWLNNIINKSDILGLKPQDIQATLLSLSARTIESEVKKVISSNNYRLEDARLIICGGGVKNKALFDLIEKYLAPVSVISSSEIDLDPDFVESTAFAYFAWARINGLGFDMQPVTGSSLKKMPGVAYFM
jgi:anhydro-N-acetylmuramic acid kinase